MNGSVGLHHHALRKEGLRIEEVLFWILFLQKIVKNSEEVFR